MIEFRKTGKEFTEKLNVDVGFKSAFSMFSSDSSTSCY